MADELPELEALDAVASLIDDESPEIGGLTVFKRGLEVSPDLRNGLLVTVLLALTAAAGRLIIPILVQLVLDRGLLGDEWLSPRLLVGCVARARLASSHWLPWPPGSRSSVWSI